MPSSHISVSSVSLGAKQLAEALACPELVAHLLISRGYQSVDSAAAFLSPTLADLHDPALMLGIPIAVERIQRALLANEPILIYGDYDVDGTTATVLLKIAIERSAPAGTKPDVRFHIPHRLREGYGMQSAVLAEAYAAGVRLVISVDNGIRAFTAAQAAREVGLDLIVTDHHLPDEAAGIPEAVAVINPNQPGCLYPHKSLCGAAVAFKLAHALLLTAARTPEARNHLERRLLPSFLKLVAIATIADSVPLTGENRTIALLGLRELANPVQPGLRALFTVSDIPSDRPPTASEVGFRIAPRINAAGRMDVASDVVDLFLTRDPELARQLAEKLNTLNEARRTTEAEALEAILEQLEERKQQQDAALASDPLAPGGTHDCVILDDEDWHRGVLGILASRVVEKTGRPALILTHEDGHAHGSGRSIEGFHLLDALTAIDLYHHAAHPEPGEALFTRFGGHAHAVGFSLPSDRMPQLRARMQHYTSLKAAEADGAEEPVVTADAEIYLDQLTPAVFHWLQRLAPFGHGNPEPVLLLRGAVLAEEPSAIKEKHLCLQLVSTGPKPLKAVGWSRQIDWLERAAEHALGPGSRIDVVFHLRLNAHPQYGGPDGKPELEILHLGKSDDISFTDRERLNTRAESSV